MQSAVDAFQKRFDECVALHGYTPDAPGNVGPNELAPTERAFSSCAYDGVRSTFMLASSQPGLYEAIIAEHQAMTDRVESGAMTRDERQARMRELRADLRAKEVTRMTDRQAGGVSDLTANLIRNASFGATMF